MNGTTASTMAVAAALVIVLNYVLNLYGVQPMPAKVAAAAGVVIHALGVAARRLFLWMTGGDPTVLFDDLPVRS